MCVWDIGANQGILAFFAASRVGTDGAVYALEADARYADMIQRSAQRLSVKYAPVTVLCAAIADQSGILEFAEAKRGHARNRLSVTVTDDFEVASKKAVAAFSGDDLLRYWKAPNFVKMDVEEAELLALQGCDRLLTQVRPTFYIEVSKRNSDAVSDLFHRYGYQLFHLKGDGREVPVERCTFYTIARPSSRE